MRQVIEGMVAMIFVVVLCVTGMDLLNVHNQAGQAKEFRNAVISTALNSDYDEEALVKCMEQAREKGYELTLLLLKPDGSHEEYEGGGIEGEIAGMQVVLSYEIQIPALHTKMKQKISATT